LSPSNVIDHRPVLWPSWSEWTHDRFPFQTVPLAEGFGSLLNRCFVNHVFRPPGAGGSRVRRVGKGERGDVYELGFSDNAPVCSVWRSETAGAIWPPLLQDNPASPMPYICRTAGIDSLSL
jgi:hypothetical protein